MAYYSPFIPVRFTTSAQTANPALMREVYVNHAHSAIEYQWPFAISVLHRFKTEPREDLTANAASQLTTGGEQWTTSRL